MGNRRRIEVGDEVQLLGYGTVGRVIEEHQHSGIRMLTVAWHIGGFHTAPEDGWLLVGRLRLTSFARENRKNLELGLVIVGIGVLGVVVFFAVLGLLT